MQTLFARHALLPDGWRRDVHVALPGDGKVGAVTKMDTSANGRNAHAVDILLPAPVNCHSHAFQRALAGLTETRGLEGTASFWTWRQVMYRFLERLSPEQLQAITAFAYMQMLEAGFATVCEFHYVHHQPDGTPYARLAEMAERVAEAAQQTGIGLTLLPVLYQQGGCDGRPLQAGQKRFGNHLEQFVRLHDHCREAVRNLADDATLGVAAHSLRAVPPENLACLPGLTPTGPIHLHLAEQQAEVDEVQAAWGKRPVAWLLDAVGLDRRWCLIHCTQMSPSETHALAKTGAVAGVCPVTEANLGDGIFDGVRWMENEGEIAVGTDSNIRIDLSEELRLFDYSQRYRDQVRAPFATEEMSSGRRLFQAVTDGGAAAADRHTGRIAPGYWADLLALDGAAIDMADRTGDSLLDSFIFTGGNRFVRDVWSAGRHVVKSGSHVHQQAITARYAAVLSELQDVL